MGQTVGQIDGFLGDGRRVVYAEEPDPSTVAALRKEHPQLGLRFLPIHKRWGVIWYWDDHDPRRRHRQEAGLPPNPDAHSLITILPEDCAPSEAAAYVRNHLHINPASDDVKKAIAKTMHANAAREEALMAGALDDVMNRIELSHTGLTEQFSEGAESTTEIGERVELSPKELREIRQRMQEEAAS